MAKKLSNKQKRAARLLITGFPIRKVAKMIHLKPAAIYRWKREEQRFNKYMKRLNDEYDQYIDRLQKALLKDAFKAIRNMLHSPNVDAVKFAVDSLLKINRRHPETTSRVLTEHKGSIDNIHHGEVQVNTKQLSKDKKKKIKELLMETRDLISTPN